MKEREITMKSTYHLIIIILLFGINRGINAQDDCIQSECMSVANITPIYGLAAHTIEIYSEPDLSTTTLDYDRLNDRRYMSAARELAIYDAPNGNIIRTIDEGFNFVTALNEQDGWIEINTGEWAKSEQLTDVNYNMSSFTGIFLPETMPKYTMAWMLVNVYPSKEPGVDPVESNGLHHRYTRVTIFSTVEIDGWYWYQIGVDKWVHQTQVAKITPIQRPESVITDRWISIDLYEQTLIVYEQNKPIFATLVSTGLPRWPTYEGTFNIYYRTLRRDMSWGTPGDDFYYLEEVPWTMFFDEGRALHGEYWHDGLGYRRSHGCVNMSISDAYWLYHWVSEEFETLTSPDVEEGPQVYVYSSGEYR